MKSKINQILNEISKKREELFLEYTNFKEKYGFKIIKWKVVFNSEVKKKHKKLKKTVLESIFSARIRDILSAPFIYVMIVPSLFLDLFLFIYQNTFFRFAEIPFVKRKDYFEYDRRKLNYLNILQKINCLYCSYVNWLFSYALEISWRTEKYRCPIKHAKKMKWWHEWEQYFADYWDPKWYEEARNWNSDFYKSQN